MTLKQLFKEVLSVLFFKPVNPDLQRRKKNKRMLQGFRHGLKKIKHK